MLHQIAPVLPGPAVDQAWPNIENSLGLDRIPEPARTLVLETHTFKQGVVLGYWDQVLTTEPAELQAWIDDKAARIQIPCLVVFGRPATDGERERLGRLPDALIAVCPGDGNFVHVVNPGWFATRLCTFVKHCDQVG